MMQLKTPSSLKRGIKYHIEYEAGTSIFEASGELVDEIEENGIQWFVLENCTPIYLEKRRIRTDKIVSIMYYEDEKQ